MNTPYDQIVAENMAHMGSRMADWQAVEIERVTESGIEFMPSIGFSPAPSIFADQSDCCQLCGTSIKHVFWIKNEARRWTMPVGSECVGRFNEESGEAMAKAVAQRQNRGLLRRAAAARAGLWKTFARRLDIGYGRTQTAIPTSHMNVYGVHRELTIRIGKTLTADQTWCAEPSSDGAITKWAKRNPDILPLIERAEELVAQKLNTEQSHSAFSNLSERVDDERFTEPHLHGRPAG